MSISASTAYCASEGDSVMTKHVSVAQARANLADLLGTVYYGKEPVVVERKGKPLAVMISPEQYERYERQVMERFGRVLDELHDLNADKDPEEVQRDIDQAVDEVRREQYEREHSQ